jgi:uncharacterized protein (DUF433 family)
MIRTGKLAICSLTSSKKALICFKNFGTRNYGRQGNKYRSRDHGGTPVFFGTRVPIKNLFDYLETGDSIETFLEDFEGVSRNQVVKVLECLRS